MSDPKNFLTRWSRRKRQSADEAAAAVSTSQVAPASPHERTDDAAAPAPAVEFDPATLPPIDSIGAGSDIRAFLQRGVPPGLTRAALRRAWAADPAIRDFIGLSENAWDFNAPNSMTGFGALAPEDVRRIAAQLFAEPGTPETVGGSSPDRNSLVQSASTPREYGVTPVHEMRNREAGGARPDQVHDLQKPEDEREKTPIEGQRKVDIAVQYKEEKPEYDPASSQKRHGGALPK